MGAEISSPFASESAPGPSSMTDEEFRARSIGKMDAEMRKKYARGSKFNFKVVIRGDSASGKSTLLRRLRGGTFLAEYAPTPEIKTAHIPWQARSSPEDVVMLEVWDVVDKARKLPVSESLTLAHPNLAETESGRHTFPLDATMVDVYKGCHAAVFLIDPSKKWTYEYALRQLKEVPEHVPTCVLVNFRDYPASKRVIRPEEVEADCEHLFGHRPFRPFVVETSLLNCYGLQALSTFLHIPFLCLKRASLEQAMQLNTHAIVQAQDALKTVKSGRYDEYERKIERAQGRGDDAGVGAGDNSAAPAGTTANGEANGESRAQNPASPEEAAITWEKLSNTTLGEAPILLGAAAVKGVVSGLGAVASATPADIAKNVSENVKSLATLKTIGLGPAEKKGHYDDQERERVAPQFSHLAGRGGAEAAAFGGEDIGDDDLTGPRPGMSGGGEHPDVSAHAGDVAGFFDTPRAGSGSGGESEDERRAPFGAADAAPSDDESDAPARRRDRNDDDDDASASPPRSRRTSSGARGVAAHRDWDDDDDGDDAKAPAAVVRWDDDDESESDADAPASAAGDASDSGEGSDGGEFRGGSASSKPGASSPKARRSFEGGSIVRQISDQDPFFGAGATAKAPSNVEVLGSGPPRAADLDLDPSAIAASLGTSSAGADAYEQVQDTAEALSRAMSGGVSAASKGSTAGSFGDALEGGSSDESSERRRRRKKKEKKSAEKSAKSSRKSKKAEKEEKPATESASKGKKKKKAVKDWDESDSD